MTRRRKGAPTLKVFRGGGRGTNPTPNKINLKVENGEGGGALGGKEKLIFFDEGAPVSTGGSPSKKPKCAPKGGEGLGEGEKGKTNF